MNPEKLEKRFIWMNSNVASSTLNSYKMLYTRRFITFSVFGVSISLKYTYVQAQSHFRF